MKKFLRQRQLISLLMIIVMIGISLPCQPLMATMIDMETLMEADQAQKARIYVNQIMAQKEVRQKLIAQGIDPREAQTRVDCLSNTEVVRLAHEIEHLPAGGHVIGVLVGAVLVVFIVLVITDILGYSDVFTFIK
jgi:hypothetical protein